MLKLYDNIRRRREELGMSQEELAIKLGYKNRSSINKIEKGINDIPQSKIVDFAKALYITPEALMGWKDSYNESETLIPIRTAAMVPIIGSVRCGPGGPAYEYIDEYVSIDDSYRKPDEIRGFRATGDSMEGDEIHDGDLCLVHLQDEVEDGALAVVVIDGEEGTLKRIRRQPGMIILEASNPAYQTRVFAGEAANTIRIIGKVVEVRHKK